MKVYRYWAPAEAPVDGPDGRWHIRCYAGSNTSLDAARARAAEIARDAGRTLPDRDKRPYLYADRPIREEVVETFGDDDQRWAAITRNRYGAFVLNTASTLFADVDYPAEPIATRIGRTVKRWIGKPGPSQDDAILERVAEVADADPHLTIRLYRTHGGFRCLVTSRAFDPTADGAERLLVALGSDPLYVKLCHAQRCFRARLTPKPWRIGLPLPPVRFPWRDERAETAQRTWERSYDDAIRDHTACAFVASFGDAPSDPIAARVTELHDRIACRPNGALA